MRQVFAATRAPSADELLEHRLASGWRPTPTAMQGGPEILGHAATRCAPDADGVACA